MPAFDTAGTIVSFAAVECGLTPVADPFASSAAEQVQLCTLLNMCGRELWAKNQWQQFVRSFSIDTTTDPITPGGNEYAFPSDYGYWINQTGWTPNNLGLGLPLGGPLSEQQWTTVVAQNLAADTIYISFKIAGNVIQILPNPPPANTSITFEYMSRAWVQPTGTTDPDDRRDLIAASADTVLFESILMVKMLAARYKEAKGLDATSSLAQFASAYQTATSINKPAPILNTAVQQWFPLINVWTNTPPTGYGM